MKFYPKELSWLAFNERVLQEAADKNVPVIERVRFLGIFSNNMDEFFRVRVADVRRRIFYARSSSERDEAEQLMSGIQSKVLRLQQQFEAIYQGVLKALARKNILIVTEDQVSPEEYQWLHEYFHDKIKRYIVPLVIGSHTDLVKAINEDATYLCVEIRHLNTLSYAAIEVPTDEVPRFIKLPFKSAKRKKKMILLDNVIRLFIDELFVGLMPFDRLQAFSFKLTRDADYRLPHDIDQSVLERMEEGIRQRFAAEPVRLVYDGEMPGAMLRFICEKFKFSAHDSLVAGGRYRNTRDFVKFQNWGHRSLENKPLPPLEHPAFSQHRSIFEAIAAQDILLYYPYHKFAHLTEIIRQAAYDPHVQSIQICVYRVAPNSRIIHSLVDAVNNGKKVTVLIELQARFDEEANIEWAKHMTQEGIRIIFGIQGLKVHSKLLLVKRVENNTIQRYAHIGTGNFNERTAQIYTDFSLFTADPRICEDVEHVFQYLESPYRKFRFHHLLVSPVNTRERLESLIEAEISAARAGDKAEILLKVNNLVDEAIIVRLYRAARAGVRVRAIVRGMCALRPGVKGLSEGIEVISIVDRFLEHPRVFCFHHGGKERIYISSADLMTRNIDHRVEVSCPIYDPQLHAQIKDILEIQWRDTTKARIIDAEQTNTYRPRGNKKKLRSQHAIYDYLLEANQRSSQ
ncbi:MAG: polyphosphate kinase 1 [Idiomarina sp.]|nr:polyphosphate kinase 1 [Idiomarina sp.]